MATEPGTNPRRRRLGRCTILTAVALSTAACAPSYPGLAGGRPPASQEYLIGPEDSLNVFVYRAPELSVQTPVRPDGRISTPLSPDVMALGKTPSQLAREIEANLKKYVQEPNVTVMVNGFRGPPNRAIRVVGEVAQISAIPYRADLSLLDVIIACHGLTRFADGNRTLVVRQGPNGPKTYEVHLDDLLKDGDLSQNIAMQPGDAVFVPQAWF
ncbi:MAG TPA: XrtA/PEP-CTERM system exopolysaccharide export protein [Stellaceae bacterium]|nr:XrtA/PEP-CTERM system exopolysaccharide export protein [Stellaceae bacterium]